MAKSIKEGFLQEGKQHAYIEDLTTLPPVEKERLLHTGVDVKGHSRAGTFMQLDNSVVHCRSVQEGVEVLNIQEALEKYAWVRDYLGGLIPLDEEWSGRRMNGYFVRVLPGVKTRYPVQASLYIGHEGLAQEVHNLVILEEEAALDIITGCATGAFVQRGLHIGITEAYVKKGAKLSFTMIHNWGEEVVVRPRGVTLVEAGGVFSSNFFCLSGVRSLLMYPTTRLAGEGAVGRYNTILVAPPGTEMDVGSRVQLSAPDTKAELIARTITTGGDIINRGHIAGEVPGARGHLECRGLMLSERGRIYAIPELEALVANVELSHEAAVGKVAEEEIEYLMARGLSEEEATSTIVRGFLNVNIEGLPSILQEEIDRAIAACRLGM
ncbi:MAG: SufD family Fe-S cluster assembly protein [Ammonifex sp.]|jgi:Fe-S cluster assembly scaffold protein SufB|nr:MAG: SufD family Fe-S cluster assembly protein [Ammonifex sp.]